jgi:hypothetical protein
MKTLHQEITWLLRKSWYVSRVWTKRVQREWYEVIKYWKQVAILLSWYFNTEAWKTIIDILNKTWYSLSKWASDDCYFINK